MGKEKRGPLALELWAKQLIDSYPGVQVRNMTTSWRNGLAFCALIHRFRPDLIDYDKLDPMDIIGNCSLAFEVAESKLGIPSLLDPLDMDAMECPDRLSVLTYVAQFYSAFKNLEAKSRVSPSRDRDENDALENRPSAKSTGSPSPDKKIVTKRKNEVDEDEIMNQVRRNMPKRAVLFNSSNLCFECKNPVFISERVLFMKKLYHRSCFCCSKCKSVLNPHIVDVSSDGKLFCLACQAELLGTTMNQGSMNKFMPDENNVRHEREKNVNQSDSSADNSKLNLPTEAASLVSSTRSRFDNVHGDSHSQGDMQVQEFAEKEGPSPELSSQRVSPIPNTPRSTRKLLDFAGALLHNEEESKSQSLPQVENPKVSIMPSVNCDPEQVQPQNSDLQESGKSVWIRKEDVLGDAEQKEDKVLTPTPFVKDVETNQINEQAKSDVLIIKSAAEVTSIRDNAILTIADQFRANVEQAEAETKSDNQQGKQIQNLKHEQLSLPSTTEEERASDSVDANLSPAEEQKPVESVVLPETDDLKKTSDEQQNSQLEDQDDGDEGKEDDESLRPNSASSVPSQASPSPVPKMRPPKPPPPKFTPSSSPTSPSPTPIPRSRNTQKPGTDDTKPTNELWKNKDYYPNELNPFASEEDLPEAVKKNAEPKNPFEDDDEEEERPPPTPSPRPKPRSEINNNGKSTSSSKGSPSLPRKNAANFNVPPPRPPPPQTSPRKLPESSDSKPYNPFEDEEDDIGEYDHEDDKASGAFSKPPPDDTSSISSKTSDLSSISGVPTPVPRSLNASDTEGSGSLKTRSRKSRRAPLPPNMMSEQTPSPMGISPQLAKKQPRDAYPETTPQRKVIPVSPKLMKGLDIAKSSNHPTGGTSTPRKKRRAPPPRRRVEPLPEAAIKTEFADLEIKLKELERQGIALETKIRSLPEETDSTNSRQGSQPGSELDDDSEVGEDANNVNEQADELMIQLWSIVNEKNEILRRQTELEYLRRGHRLEEMQSELEFKLRVLMDTPEDQKQPNQADMESALLHQLLKLVDERNEVVEWLDYHRQKDREEELMLAKSITEFSNSKAVEPIPDQVPSSSKSKSKDKKHKDKPKEDKEKKDGKLRLGIFKKKNKKCKPVEGTTTNNP